MHAKHTWLMLPIAFVMLALSAGARGQTPAAPRPPDNPYPYAEHEATAERFSLAKSAEYLDGVARFWMQKNSCGACHANFAYVMARPLLGGNPAPLVDETRRFLEQRKPDRPDFSFDGEAVGIAFALAWDDARTSGKLQPTTRQALGRMWTLQRPEGMWCKMGCGRTLPAENDYHYTAILATLAAGIAPEGYARTAEARDGLTKLRRYFVKVPARDLHDEAMRLWASLHIDGVMTTDEREATVRSLLARQGRDGSWSLAALSSRTKLETSEEPPGDGYGTALAVYVLRQAGVPAARPEIARGVDWLRSHQRASGRWFSPSRAAEEQTEGGVGTRDLYVQNLGTAFAVLALKACEETDDRPGPGTARLLRQTPGLGLRVRLISD